MGHWCRHDWALWSEGLVDFTANLAIDKYYGRLGSPEGPTVFYELEGGSSPYRITLPWNYASENTCASELDLAHTVFSTTEQKIAEDGHKQVSESAARRNMLYDIGSGTNSASLPVRQEVDSLLVQAELLLANSAKLSKVNKGKTTNFNPLPKHRNKIEITINKSTKD
jgi:hypothetical protein